MEANKKEVTTVTVEISMSLEEAICLKDFHGNMSGHKVESLAKDMDMKPKETTEVSSKFYNTLANILGL